MVDPNRPMISLPSSPPPFSPPNYAIWVNALWFLSLATSLTCALLANLLQQWARRYLRVTQSRYSLHKRARIRAYLAEGGKKLHLLWTVKTLPTLLHISLFLFFAGLVVFLWNVHLTIFKLMLSWVGVCTALYGCITVMPIFRHDSPYHTPLSLPTWHVVTGIQFLTFRALQRLARCFSGHTYHLFGDLAERHGEWLVQGMQKTAEETALSSPSEIDTRAFLWTFESLDEDHELEHFFFGLPGFRGSKVVKDPLPSLTNVEQWRLLEGLMGLLDRTFSSDTFPEPDKKRRLIICAKALNPEEIHDGYQRILHSILFTGYRYRGLETAEFGRIIRGWAYDRSGNQDTALLVEAILDSIVAKATRRDDSWFILASDRLGIKDAALRNYAAHGDSLSLAILIHITRQQFKSSWPAGYFWKILQVALAFDVQDTLPKLQHEFCALWNQIVLEAQKEHNHEITWDILRPIRDVHLALHQHTDFPPPQFSTTDNWDVILKDPSSYPECNFAGHIHEYSASTVPTPFTPVVPHNHDNNMLTPSFINNSLDAPSSSAPVPLRVDEDLTDVPPLDNDVSVPVSMQSAYQTIAENRRIPAISLDPGTTHATHGGVETSVRMMPPNPSASNFPPKSRVSYFPPDAVAVSQTTNSITPSDGPDVPSSLPTTVLEHMSPSTGPPSSSDSPVTGSDH